MTDELQDVKEETEENHENPQSGHLLSLLSFEPGTSGTQVRSLTV
jgi:hypothetical protein